MSRALEPGSRWWRLAAGLLLAVGVAAVVAGPRAFNNMYDEPAHLAAGMEWLDRGTYTLEPQHPPLSRIASAIVPWLAGERSHGHAHMYTEGRLILGRGAHYERVLTLARLGQLPFFLLLGLTTWFWARRLADERTAAAAVFFVVVNPNLLAHAGVAGTDIGPAATMPAALLAWVLWLEQPTWRRSVLMGIAVAVCGLTKFSALAFWLPAAIAAAAFTAFDRPAHTPWPVRRYALSLAGAILAAALTTWATYRFSVGPVGGLMLPAPEFWTGVRDFFRHGTGGHPAFLLGNVRLGGWWYYDLVAFLVKTPIPLLAFAAVGARVPAAQRAPLFAVLSVLLVASLTPVDIGVRLLLPAYGPLAILAAVGASWAWNSSRARGFRAVVGALALWALAIPVRAHPDHIAYFNAFAGRHPERVLVDSNLDWGQDLYRLRSAMRDLRMDSLRIHYFGTAELAAVGLDRARRLRPTEQAAGWVAASETFYAGVWSDTALYWLRRHEPVARVGASIRLYFIPPEPAPPPGQAGPPAPPERVP